MGTSETVKCVGFNFSRLQFNFVTSLHVTLTRQEEISADIFVRLLRYFSLSYKN